jgi:hypothetical protein
MKTLLLLGTAALALAACGGSNGSARRAENPWFPLRPGTTYTYKGSKDGKPSRDVVTVTRETKVIQRVRCTVVRDLLYLRGRLEERTADWYAQDRAGNVWYYGEDTAELDAHARVTTREGSWQAGVGGARAGIFMPAHPRVGQQGLQEYLSGHAEDHFQVLSLSAHRLLTKEWTPLEPGVIDHKLYARGIGTVREETVKGGSELNVLQSVTRSP